MCSDFCAWCVWRVCGVYVVCVVFIRELLGQRDVQDTVALKEEK